MDDMLRRNRMVTRASHRLTLLTLCLVVMIAQIDTFIVNLGARAIGEHFDASMGELQWIVDSYNLVYAVSLLTGGMLADIHGRRRILLVGGLIFTAASLVCAAAPTAPVLILGRALTGAGGALMIPASLAIIRVVWDQPGERARALGVWAACNGVAMALGPSLGGLLLPWFGWRSIFLVVVPFAVLALILAGYAIPESSDPRPRPANAAAQLFGALALGSLTYAAISAHSSPHAMIAALMIAMLSAALFVAIERKRGAEALLSPDILAVPEFRGAMAATLGMTFGGYGMVFVLALAWQASGRLDAAASAAALLPMSLVFILVAPFSGALSERLGIRVATSGGVTLMGIGLLLIGAGGLQRNIAPAEFGLAITGLGLGLGSGPLSAMAVGHVAAARAGMAAALINVARISGATIGVAVLGACYSAAGGGTQGLLLSMMIGSLVQFSGAAIAWMMTQREGVRPI
ncbi:Multidrug resistance protein Stp [Bradyrhizobium ivorense]|uniref:Multidrug resistance protein Stp n=1 Tax=Bradyrhizobium ivorense TaxID=2511166 RepID=A0A508T2V1_9BRAD|nr:MFS transporter [Bradyrhizobium ivorense]VIO68074.1 Multidrug resistance protein Stp [Bradyrhizobium ivorense]